MREVKIVCRQIACDKYNFLPTTVKFFVAKNFTRQLCINKSFQNSPVIIGFGILCSFKLIVLIGVVVLCFFCICET